MSTVGTFEVTQITALETLNLSYNSIDVTSLVDFGLLLNLNSLKLENTGIK